MAKRIVYHVSHDQKSSRWQVTKEGGKRAVKTFSTKEKAVDHGRKAARKEKLGQLKIHKKNGRLQTEYTYGADPVRYPS